MSLVAIDSTVRYIAAIVWMRERTLNGIEHHIGNNEYLIDRLLVQIDYI